MAGKETQGIDAADADLFRGKPWVIVPSVDAPEGAVNSVIALAQTVGAEPFFMDAEEHDSYVAAISHLPLTVASALFSVAWGSAAWPELASLASSGFRDTTRLASGSPEMAHDIMQTNRDNVVHWIDRLVEELIKYRGAIAAGESEPLLQQFTRPQMERDNYVAAGPPRRPSGEPMPKVSMNDFLFGSAVGNMMRKQDEVLRKLEEREKKR
jgi:prephenate dehydrogenase